MLLVFRAILVLSLLLVFVILVSFSSFSCSSYPSRLFYLPRPIRIRRSHIIPVIPVSSSLFMCCAHNTHSSWSSSSFAYSYLYSRPSSFTCFSSFSCRSVIFVSFSSHHSYRPCSFSFLLFSFLLLLVFLMSFLSFSSYSFFVILVSFLSFLCSCHPSLPSRYLVVIVLLFRPPRPNRFSSLSYYFPHSCIILALLLSFLCHFRCSHFLIQLLVSYSHALRRYRVVFVVLLSFSSFSFYLFFVIFVSLLSFPRPSLFYHSFRSCPLSCSLVFLVHLMLLVLRGFRSRSSCCSGSFFLALVSFPSFSSHSCSFSSFL